MKARFLSLEGFLLCVLIVLCLFILSCKKEPEAQPEKESVAQSSVSKQPLFKIRFREKWHPQTQFAGIYMAQKKGFYESYGLELEIQPYLSNPESLKRLKEQKSDIVTLDLLSSLDVNKDENFLQNIGQCSQVNSILLIARKSRGINSLEDFNGKTLGVWHSASNLITTSFIKGMNLDVKIVPIEWSINLFTQGVVDIINAMSYNEYHQILQAGIPKEDLFVYSLAVPGYEIPDDGYYVTSEFYKAHPKECQAFMEATIDGWTYAFTHPQETVDEVLSIMQRAKVRANRSHQIWMLDTMKDIMMARPDQLGRLNEDDFNNALALMQRVGKIKRKISYQEFYPHAAQ